MQSTTPTRVVEVRLDADQYRALAPGERFIDGRVYYSAAWLDNKPANVIEPKAAVGLPIAAGEQRRARAERRD